MVVEKLNVCCLLRTIIYIALHSIYQGVCERDEGGEARAVDSLVDAKCSVVVGGGGGHRDSRGIYMKMNVYIEYRERSKEERKRVDVRVRGLGLLQSHEWKRRGESTETDIHVQGSENEENKSEK